MSIINLTTPMSDDKERECRTKAVLDAIERYTEERMNDENTNGNRSGGQPALKPCPFCGSLPKSGDSTYGYWLIFCSDENNCLAQPSVELKTEAEAIAAWNTRQPTQSDALQAENDQLRHDLERQMTIANEHVNEVERLREALDLLGVALAEHGHTWTVEERTAYEKARAILEQSK